MQAIKEDKQNEDPLLDLMIENLGNKRKNREDSDDSDDEVKKFRETGEISEESDEIEKAITMLNKALQNGEESDASIESNTSTVTPMEEGH